MFKLSLVFLSLLTIQSASSETLTGKVLSIHDGDTITVQIKNTSKKEKIRLLGVDTPEMEFNGQSQGAMAERARDYLKSMLPLESAVVIELPEKGSTDVNGRYLGKIIFNGVDLNLEMLKAGMGAIYFIHPYDKKTVIEYMKAAELAALSNVGFNAAEYKSKPLGYVFRQMVRGVDGTNTVGNFVTKKLYSGSDLELVPAYHRVFFSSAETALIHGFNW